jgi:hypothetical protein
LLSVERRLLLDLAEEAIAADRDLLTTVVYTTCPTWSPHLETAIEQFL